MSSRALHLRLQIAAIACMLLALSSLLWAEGQKDAELLQLAQEKFEHKLSKLEQRVVRAAALGQVAWTDPDQTDAGDTENIYSLADKNAAYDTDHISKDELHVVRAELIEWLCTDEKARALLDSHGIEVVGAWIDGRLELSFLSRLNVPIKLLRCQIPGGISMPSAELSNLELPGSSIGDNRAWGLHLAIDGQGVKIHGNVLLSDGFKSSAKVDLYGAQIDGGLFCSGGHSQIRVKKRRFACAWPT
jgi:hypothetical protein